jgi:hypothetical protein
MIVFFVSNAAMNGNVRNNPYNFQHFYLSELSLHVDVRQVPSTTLQPDFENNQYIEAYLSTFTGTGLIYKVGTQRIKLTPEAWMELINLKDEVDTHFHQDTYKFLTLSIDNLLTVSIVESHGNRLFCLEQFESPVKPTNQPKSPVKLWLSDKQWSVLRRVKTWVDTIFDRYLKSANGIQNIFETLGDCINVTYGTSLTRSYGDLVQLQ